MSFGDAPRGRHSLRSGANAVNRRRPASISVPTCQESEQLCRPTKFTDLTRAPTVAFALPICRPIDLPRRLIFTGKHHHPPSYIQYPLLISLLLSNLCLAPKEFLCLICSSIVMSTSACAAHFAWYWPAFSTERAVLFSISFKHANRCSIST